MRAFSIYTLGCKVNQYESQQIRQLLQELGLKHVDMADKPEFVIINTCCVTAGASAKSRQYIRRASRLNPFSKIIVCGCLPIAQVDELSNLNGDFYLVKNRNNLAAEISRIVNCQTSNVSSLPQIKSFEGHTRAFLKVQDGCDGCCSYCIIPKARPYVRSRPINQVIKEAKQLADAGHREIVLTGIYLGAFGQETVRRSRWPGRQNPKLAELLDKVAQIPALERIRLSSLGPADVTDQLLDVFCEHRNIMAHLHLSLQSGSDTVLKRMCRQYCAAEFQEKAELIKQRLDKPAITTDIIVGFPGETEREFQATVELARQVGFAKMHIFSFSPRKSTPAAAMKDTVPGRQIKRRFELLRQLDTELGYKFREQFIGRTDTVLIEGIDGALYGRSTRYFKITLETNRQVRQNDIVKVRLIGNLPNGALGQILPEKANKNSNTIKMKGKNRLKYCNDQAQRND